MTTMIKTTTVSAKTRKTTYNKSVKVRLVQVMSQEASLNVWFLIYYLSNNGHFWVFIHFG